MPRIKLNLPTHALGSFAIPVRISDINSEHLTSSIFKNH